MWSWFSSPLPISVSLTVNIPWNCLFLTHSIGKLINIHGFRDQLYAECPQIFLSRPDVPFKLQRFRKFFLLEPRCCLTPSRLTRNIRCMNKLMTFWASTGCLHLEVPPYQKLKYNKTKLILSSHLSHPPNLLILLVCISPICTILPPNQALKIWVAFDSSFTFIYHI